MSKRIAYSELWLAVGGNRDVVTANTTNFTNIYRDLENDPNLSVTIGTRVENANSHGREAVFHNTINQRAEISIDVPFPNSLTLAEYQASWIYKIFQISYMDFSATGDADSDGVIDNGETWADIIAKNRDLDCGRYGTLLLVSPDTVHLLTGVKAKWKVTAVGSDDDFPKMSVTFYGLYQKFKASDDSQASLGSVTSNAVISNMGVSSLTGERVETATELTVNSYAVDFADSIEFDDGRDIKFYQYIKSADAIGGEFISAGYKPRLSIKAFSYDGFNFDEIVDLNSEISISFKIGKLTFTAPKCQLEAIPTNPEQDGFERTEKTFVIKKDSDISANYKITFDPS
jgi:hypothetical protein